MSLRDQKLRWFCLHVFALSGLVLAQPVYSWISAEPQFLIAHGGGGAVALLLVLLLSLFLPLIVLIFALPWRLLGRRVFIGVQVFWVGVLVGLFGLHAMPVGPGAWAGAVFVVFAAAGGVMYWRQPLFRSVLSGLAVLAVMLPALFVGFDPVRSLVFSEGAALQAVLGEEGAESALEVPPDKSVVMVMLDELAAAQLLDSRQKIDSSAFPGFARLAESAVWYPQAATVNSGTTISMIGMATGSVPIARNASWQAYPDNLFTWLPGVYGQHVNVDEFMTNLCPEAICGQTPNEQFFFLASDTLILVGHALLPEPWARRFLPPVDQQWNRFLDIGGVGTALIALMGRDLSVDRMSPWDSFLESLQAEPRGFYFHHLILPHYPYEYLPDGQQYADALALQSYRPRRDYRALHILEYQRHMAQTQYADRLLTQLIDRMQDVGMWEDTLLVVFADHGRSFRKDSHWRILDQDNPADVINVPLFIKFPDQQKGLEDAYPASLIDITPTIADVLGRDLGWEVSGHSLVDEARAERSEMVVSCGGWVGCDGTHRERAGPDLKLSFGMDEYTSYLADTRIWMSAHRHWSKQMGLFVPPGPEAELLGMSVVDVPLDERAQGKVEWFNAEAFVSVDTDSGELPALVAGYAEAPGLTENDLLVIAMNGRLVGVGVLGRYRNRLVFGALLPSDAFVDGNNEIEVYRAHWAGEELRSLSRLEHVDAI